MKALYTLGFALLAGIGAEREQSGLAERDEAGESDEDIQADRDHAVDQLRVCSAAGRSSRYEGPLHSRLRAARDHPRCRAAHLHDPEGEAGQDDAGATGDSTDDGDSEALEPEEDGP
jgi:hypothetical protein